MARWLNGVAVACIAVALRLCVASLNNPQELAVYEFGFTDTKSSPSAWKEYLILQLHGTSSSQVHVSTFQWLRTVGDVGGSIVNGLLLKNGWWFFCVIDGLVAWMFWMCGSPDDGLANRSWVHALNPLLLCASYLHSAAPVEYFVLFVLVQACGSHSVKRQSLFLRVVLAACFLCCLGVGYLTVCALLLFDVVWPSRTRAVVAASSMVLFAALLVTWDAVMDAPLMSHDLPTRLASMSPDIGPSWYVWQLMPPVFDRPYTTIMKWMPVVMTAPILLRCTMTTASGDASTIRRRRLFLAIWGVCASLVCRPTYTIPDLVFAVELICIVTPNIARRMDHLFLPVVGSCMCLPLQRAFYVGWVSMRVMNANWLFFTCVFQMAAFVMFLISYLAVFLEDIVVEDANTKKVE